MTRRDPQLPARTDRRPRRARALDPGSHPSACDRGHALDRSPGSRCARLRASDGPFVDIPRRAGDRFPAALTRSWPGTSRRISRAPSPWSSGWRTRRRQGCEPWIESSWRQHARCRPLRPCPFGPRLVSSTGRSARRSICSWLRLPPVPCAAALQRSGLPPALVTGAPALQHDITPILADDLRRGELIAVLVALALLSIVLGLSLALVVPLLVAACTGFAALAVVYLLAHEFLDGALCPEPRAAHRARAGRRLLAPHRAQVQRRAGGLATGKSSDAIVTTMADRGADGARLRGRRRRRPLGSSPHPGAVRPLARLCRARRPARGSIGGCAHAAAGAAVAARQARRGRRLGPAGLGADRAPKPGLWSRLAGIVMRRPLVVLVCSAAALAVAAAPALWLELTPGSVVAIPQGIQSARALYAAARPGRSRCHNPGRGRPRHGRTEQRCPGAGCVQCHPAPRPGARE